jgi:transposase
LRRKVLDLLRAGRTVAQVAADLQISDQTIYNWRAQELIDTRQRPGLSSSDTAELVARRRIAELETELAVTRRAMELLKQAMPQTCGTRPSPRWPLRASRAGGMSRGRCRRVRLGRLARSLIATPGTADLVCNAQMVTYRRNVRRPADVEGKAFGAALRLGSTEPRRRC